MTDESHTQAFLLALYKEKEKSEALERGEIWVDFDEGVDSMFQELRGRGSNNVEILLDPFSSFFGEGEKLVIKKIEVPEELEKYVQ